MEKAASDLKMAEIGVQHDAPTDTVAFHLQQAAEKMLKALLASRMIVYPKTHDLDDLLDLLPAGLSGVLAFRDRILGWTSYAVDMRYEISSYPDSDELRQAITIATELRTAVLALINPTALEAPLE